MNDVCATYDQWIEAMRAAGAVLSAETTHHLRLDYVGRGCQGCENNLVGSVCHGGIERGVGYAIHSGCDRKVLAGGHPATR